MVIWYAKERMIQGPVFGSKDFFHGLAIVLDTYSNHNGPHNVTYCFIILVFILDNYYPFLFYLACSPVRFGNDQ